MLTETERKGFRQILNKLTDGELMSLKDTVTKKQIVTNDKSESIDAIITYTERAVDLLKRKKVKRDILFQYLVGCGVVVNVSAEKHEIIKRILTFWGTSFDIGEIEESSSSESLSLYGRSETTTPQNETWADHRVGHERERLGASFNNSHPHQSTVRAEADSAGLVVTASSLETSSPAVAGNVSRQVPVDERFTLGKQFVEWFYKILNSHNSSLQDVPDGEFGPQHFWSDCRLEMKFDIQGQTSSEEYEGSMLVAHRFLALVKEERLLFNPNVSVEGIRVKTEPHGLVLVMTCGTLHRVNDCLGVFEQIFGLVSDPTLDNNWKVKVSHLKMKSSQPTTMPKLENSEQTLAIGHTG